MCWFFHDWGETIIRGSATSVTFGRWERDVQGTFNYMKCKICGEHKAYFKRASGATTRINADYVATMINECTAKKTLEPKAPCPLMTMGLNSPAIEKQMAHQAPQSHEVKRLSKEV